MTIDNWDDILKRVNGGARANAFDDARTAIARQLEQLAPASNQGAAANAGSGGGTRRVLGAVSSLAPAAGASVSQGLLPSLVQAALPSTQDSGGGVGGKILSAFTSVLGLSPLISGLLSLFGGGGKDPLPPLVRFALPDAVNLQSGLSSSGGIGDVSYGQNGLPRIAQSAAAGPGAPQITVQVQAMDSKSFLDHSEDIARAVRSAMLYSHSLNDVVADL